MTHIEYIEPIVNAGYQVRIDFNARTNEFTAWAYHITRGIKHSRVVQTRKFAACRGVTIEEALRRLYTKWLNEDDQKAGAMGGTA